MTDEGPGVPVACQNDACDYETLAFGDEETPESKIACAHPDVLPWCPVCPGEAYLLIPVGSDYQ